MRLFLPSFLPYLYLLSFWMGLGALNEPRNRRCCCVPVIFYPSLIATGRSRRTCRLSMSSLRAASVQKRSQGIKRCHASAKDTFICAERVLRRRCLVCKEVARHQPFCRAWAKTLKSTNWGTPSPPGLGRARAAAKHKMAERC